jgi:hypothetical protein
LQGEHGVAGNLDQQKVRQMALDTRIWSMWRRHTSHGPRRAVGRFTRPPVDLSRLRDAASARCVSTTVTSATRCRLTELLLEPNISPASRAVPAQVRTMILAIATVIVPTP